MSQRWPLKTNQIVITAVAILGRGHTGQPLHATPSIVLIYVGVVGAAVARILAGFDIGQDALLRCAALSWIAGFAIFAVVFWPILTRPRIESAAA